MKKLDQIKAQLKEMQEMVREIELSPLRKDRAGMFANEYEMIKNRAINVAQLALELE